MSRFARLALLLVLVTLCQGSSLVYRTRQEPDDVTTYYFVADGKSAPYAFLNHVGVLVGFDVDIVDAVCRSAGKRCFFILAGSTQCIFTDRNLDYAGEGIQSGWFDACPGYAITNDRENNFDFTLPYLKSSCHFAVKHKNPDKFDPESSDFSKFTIVKINGDASNAPCLTRIGKKFSKIIDVQDLPEAVRMVENGTADVLMSSRGHAPGLDTLPRPFHCSDLGAGVMLRKGSNIKTWWNEAFQTLYMSGDYHKLCQRAERKYHSKPNCLASPEEERPELLALMKELPKNNENERLWRFVASGRIAPASYLNQQGILEGFTKELISHVCTIAGKRCVLMTAEVSECTILVGEMVYPGRGISRNWFDGCPGYFNSAERLNSWDFTAPYLVSAATFRVKPGNPTGFDPSRHDLSKWTIVYLATAISNQHCLNKLNKKYGKLLVVEDPLEAQALVLNGTADAWFSKYHKPTDLETLPEEFQCQNAATSIMLKKGSEVPAWWNPAFQEFYQSGAFNRFCDEQTEKYKGHHFPCLPPPALRGQPLEGF